MATEYYGAPNRGAVGTCFRLRGLPNYNKTLDVDRGYVLE